MRLGTLRALVIAGSVALIAASDAGAISLIADPGPPGSYPGDALFPIADPGALLGAGMNGQSVDVEVMMADMRHLQAFYVPADTRQYTLRLELLLDQFSAGFPGLTQTGFLADENGQSLLAGQNPGASRTANAPFLIGWSLSFFEPADELIHHGIHFAGLVFPDIPGPTVTGAQLRLTIFDGGEPPFSTLVVGEWSVPEPSLAALGLAGAVAVFARRRRRPRSD